MRILNNTVEAMIGILSILSSESTPSIMFIFSQFLADAIHDLFVKFHIEEVCKYTSVLVYMFVYFQASRFQFTMRKVNEDSQPQSIIFWTTMLMKEHKDYTYKIFVEAFVHPTMSLLNNTMEPRINEDTKKVMQLLDQVRTRDWYLYQKYKEIRIRENFKDGNLF